MPNTSHPPPTQLPYPAIIINALNGHHPNFMDKETNGAESVECENGILAPKPVRDRFLAGA
jgi:hypothetical protein